MVGSSPITTTDTNVIKAQIIPLAISINGISFDPTVQDLSCLKDSPVDKIPLTLLEDSPLVKFYNFVMNGVSVGNTQYADAFQRANFWKYVSQNGAMYHVLMDFVPLPKVSLDASAHAKILDSTNYCHAIGAVEINWFDKNYLQAVLIPHLQSQGLIGPNTFPLFMLYNIAFYDQNRPNIPIAALGYHNATGTPVQTYSAFDFDLTGYPGIQRDTYNVSHEIAEWMDDPLGGTSDPLSISLAPSWGIRGSPGCQSWAEVGDPLVGSNFPNVTMPNGYAYHLQEVSFISWFYGPSIGAGNKFSNNGTLAFPAKECETMTYGFKGGQSDGMNPRGGLIQDGSGNLYGVTSYGGNLGGVCAPNGCGIVFKIDPLGNETVLHSFTGGADGGFPLGRLVLDSANNLYGTCTAGGLGAGVVFKLDPNGNETVLYPFKGGPDGVGPSAGLVRDSAGNLYGTTQFGGILSGDCSPSGCGVVFKVDPNGNESVLYSFVGGMDGKNPFSELLRDSAGNLFGTTPVGGINSCTPSGCGIVFKVDSGDKETVLYRFTGGADGEYPQAGLIEDLSGNLYSTTVAGGLGAGVVFRVDQNGNETVLYSFTGKNGDGVGPSFASLVRDAAGNLYGTTQFGGQWFPTRCPHGCGTVFSVDPHGNEVILYSFTGDAYDGANPFNGLTKDVGGSFFYGTTYNGGKLSCNGAAGLGCGVVFKLPRVGAGDSPSLFRSP